MHPFGMLLTLAIEETGATPEEALAILDTVYTECRENWTHTQPGHIHFVQGSTPMDYIPQELLNRLSKGSNG
jgi:hypothetical protein